MNDAEYLHAKRRALLAGICLFVVAFVTALVIVLFVVIGNANAQRQRDHDADCAARYATGSVDYFMCVGP